MKKIELRGERGKDKFALVDDEDYEKLQHFSWHLHNSNYAIRTLYVKVGRFGKKPGIVRPKKYIKILMHREIMGSKDSDDTIYDHINLNTLDNRKSNLRACNWSQNQMNKKSFAKSGYKGVYRRPETGKWRATIRLNYKSVNIGQYDTKEEAALAYNKKAKELFGGFALLNKVT